MIHSIEWLEMPKYDKTNFAHKFHYTKLSNLKGRNIDFLKIGFYMSIEISI